MRLYVHMILCGSTCTLLYWILNRFCPRELPLACRRIFLRVNAALYLLPVPWLVAQLKGYAKRILEMAGMVFPEGGHPDVMDLTNIWKSYLIYDENGRLIHVSGYERWLPFLLAGALVYLVLTGGWLIRYLRICSRYKKGTEQLDKEQYVRDERLRRRVRIASSSRIASPVTLGVFRPVILLPADREQFERGMEGVMLHELGHVTGRDMPVRLLLAVVRMTMWFNPLVHYLAREELAVSEMLCDEAAVKGRTKAEKADYMRCVLEAADRQDASKLTAASLGAPKRLLTERIERIMENNRKKIWKRELAAVIMAGCFLISGIPAYAYQDPVKISTVGKPTADGMGEWNDDGEVIFTPEGKIQEISPDFSQSDFVFLSEEGCTYYFNGYMADENGQIRASCSHSYESGTMSRHVKNSDGGCTVTTYNAKRCTKCGNVESKTEISTTTYKSCPH